MYNHVCVEELCGLLADLAAGDCLMLMQCSLHEMHRGPWPYMYMWACPMYLGGGGGGGGHSICGSSLHLSLCAYACVFLCEHACAYACMHTCVYHEGTVTIIISSTGSPHQLPVVGQYVRRRKLQIYFP